jgi:tetratricopeptide (TPR) repeat protein
MPSQDAHEEPIEQSSAPASTRWKRIAAKVRAHPRVAIAAAATAVFLAAGLATAWLLLRPAPFNAAQSAAAALELLDQGDFDAAKKLAEDIQGRTEEDEPLAAASYVLGAAGAAEAEKATGAAKRPLFLLAARWLQDALARGLAEQHSGEAHWLLGRSLYEAGEIAQCQSALAEAVAARPERTAQIRQLLADAYLRDRPPRFTEALEQNKLYLADEHLTASRRLEGILQQAEILVTMGKPAESLEALAAIPPDARQLPPVNVLRGRALLQEAQALKSKGASPESQRQAGEKRQAAMSALKEAQDSDPGRSTASGRQAVYVAGLCLLESGDTTAALDQFGQLRKADPAAPEFLAAAFQEGNALRSLKRETEAAEAFCRALDAVGRSGDFRNPWVSVEQLRDRVLEAYRYHLEAHGFAPASELARRAEAVLPADRVLEMRAETHRAWGRDLVPQAETADPARTAALVREGRRQLRLASRFWQRLAQCRATTRFYPEDLWEGALCALEGRDYLTAAKLFDEYVKAEPRGRRPKALAALGESLLCQGRIDEAIQAFRDCIEQHARDEAAPRARLLASQAYLEKGDVAAAQRLLEANLSGESLTPASREYRESLFALGRLLHQFKRYEEAAAPLEEAVSRYPNLRQTTEARYLIADCHRRRALGEQEKLRHDLVEQSRGARVRRMSEAFTSSLKWYRQTQEALLKRQETAPLDPLEKLMLRNSCYFIGSLLIDLRQYAAAITAYTEAANRYPASPETLEAHVQIARAFRALNKPSEARDAVDQAKLLLARMKPVTPIEQTTNYSKSQWTARLERLSTM